MEIQKTNDISPNKIKALIFGDSGVGKTRLASTLGESTLIISLDAGLLSLRGFNVDYIEIKTLEELRIKLPEVFESDYKNIYIDSLTNVSELYHAEAKVKYKDDKNTMQMYGHVLEKMSAFIRRCRSADKNIFLTALQKMTSDDIGRRFLTPDLVGSIANKCPAYFDMVFNYQVVQNDNEFKRFLVTNKTDTVVAKDRSGKLDLYEKPDLSHIINKVFS